MQQLPAGDEQPEVRADFQESGKVNRTSNELLEVVQHEYDVPRMQGELEESKDRLGTRLVQS